MCRFAAERMSYATAEARCAAAPAGGGEVCHIINPINDRRFDWEWLIGLSQPVCLLLLARINSEL